MLIELLTNYGFSPREAKIYLTCLEFGQNIVSSIARRAKENRVTTYSILKDLAKKWLANEVIKNKKKYYSVISPEKLIKKQEEKTRRLKKALPELLSVQSEYAHKPKVFFYEGVDGLKEIYEDLLTTTQDVRWFRYSTTNEEFTKYINEEFFPKRVKAKINIKNIIPMELNDDLQNLQNKKQHLRETRTIKDKDFILKNDILIYWENKVLIGLFDKKQLSWLLIQSKTLHDSLSSIFNLTRKSLKK